MKMDVLKFCGNHLPILMKICAITDGSILEIGTGAFSTPYLHWFCSNNKRDLVSVENSDEYFDFAKDYESDFHKVLKEVPDGNWDIVFIDSFPIENRIDLVKQFADTSKYIIVHDTEKFPCDVETKYRKDIAIESVQTSIFSNLIELDLWQ